jgi:hypothetical protein
MANFNFGTVTEFDVDTGKARAELTVLAGEVHVYSRDMVDALARRGAHVMKDNIPEGQTGNLRRAVQHDLRATIGHDVSTGRFQAGTPYSSKVYISPRSQGRRLEGGGTSDDPLTYALAVNDGRRPLAKPADSRPGSIGQKFFTWFSTGNFGGKEVQLKLVNRKANVFAKSLQERMGVHFIERTQAAMETYIQTEELDRFIRRLRRGPESRARFREGMGLGTREHPLGADLFLPE